jgi:hypothetical protein
LVLIAENLRNLRNNFLQQESVSNLEMDFPLSGSERRFLCKKLIRNILQEIAKQKQIGLFKSIQEIRKEQKC